MCYSSRRREVLPTKTSCTYQRRWEVVAGCNPIHVGNRRALTGIVQIVRVMRAVDLPVRVWNPHHNAGEARKKCEAND